MSLPRLGHDPRRERGSESSPSPEWVPELGCWCAYDAETVAAILKSADFVLADFAEIHQTYEQRAGIDCSAIIDALPYVATANEGKRHAEIRREMARILTTNTAQTKQPTSAKVKKVVPALCRPGQRVDLVKEIIQPVCNTMFEGLLGASIPGQPDEGVSASQIFDIYLGLNRRRQINAKACALLEGFTAASGALKTSPSYAAGLSMVGYDSIVGTLGASLLQVFRNTEGQRLCDIAFPRVLPATGVPYVERFAAKDRVIGGATIGKGARVRLYIDSGTSDENASNRPYFGRGRHSCLGEEMSTWLWLGLVEEFSRLPVTCTVESRIRRKPDWVFVYYSSILVRFDA